MKLFSILLTLLSPMLFASQEKALLMALDDEYKAKSTYEQVMKDFGKQRPFSQIIQSEIRHIQALEGLFHEYGISIPPNPYGGKVGFYQSVQEACKAGIEAEIENVALYDEIFSYVQDEKVRQVFERLRSASQNRHLPAFQRCANR